MISENLPAPRRRSFLSGFQAALASAATLALGAAASAEGQSKAPARFEPARHDKDDWLDQIPGKHRLVFDSTTPDGFGEALRFAGNYVRVNHADYGLEDSDLAVVIVARHRATPFGYKDAFWAKYGPTLAPTMKFDDPRTKAAPIVNVYNLPDSAGGALPNGGTTIDSVTKSGVQFAVCNSATRALSGIISKAVGKDSEEIYKEMVSNLVANARIVPAGIVAVSRAQERGYTLVKA